MISQAAFYGGAKYTVTGAAVTLFLTVAAVQTVQATNSGLNIKLGSARQLPQGKLGLVVNDGANSFNLVDNGSNLLVVLAPGECVDLALLDNSTAAGVWWFKKAPVGIVPDPPISLYAYLIGGNAQSGSDKQARQYNPQLEVWTQKTDLPSPTVDADWPSVAVVGSKGYVAATNEGSSSSFNRRNMLEYDPDTWTFKTDSTNGIMWGGATHIGSDAFYSGSGATSYPEYAQLYTPGSDSWAIKTPRTTGHHADNSPATTVNGKALFTVGQQLGGGGTGYNVVDVYVVDTWTNKTTRPGATATEPGTTSDGVTAWSYGGASTVFLANVYSYTESIDTWAAMTNLPAPTRKGSGCCHIAGLNYVMAGNQTNTSTVSSLNTEHDPVADTYLTKPPVSSGNVNQCLNGGRAITP